MPKTKSYPNTSKQKSSKKWCMCGYKVRKGSMNPYNHVKGKHHKEASNA